MGFKQWLNRLDEVNRIVPPKEDLYELMDANFRYGVIQGTDEVDINLLRGGTSISSGEKERVEELKQAMSAPDGYIERLVIDDKNNVIEGQHRLEALRELGVQKVPVVRVVDMENVYNVDGMENAIRSAKPGLHPDHVTYLMKSIFDSIAKEGSPEAVLQQYEMPPVWQGAWEAALKAA